MIKSSKLWLIPAAFFAVCCVLNLVGCLTDGNLERCVKPALMLLLSLTTVTYLFPRLRLSLLAGSRFATLPTEWAPPSSGAEGGTFLPTETAAGEGAEIMTVLLLCGQLFGFAGDTMLLGKGFPFFAGGIGLFLIGHVFYICLFGGKSWKGLKAWHWIAAMAACLALVAGLILAIGVNGIMLLPMSIYGFVLALLMFSTLAGAIRFGGITWWTLFAGAVLFSTSDALIAVHKFSGISYSMSSFVVMSTYLAAQTLLAAGGIRIILGKD